MYKSYDVVYIIYNVVIMYNSYDGGEIIYILGYNEFVISVLLVIVYNSYYMVE